MWWRLKDQCVLFMMCMCVAGAVQAYSPLSWLETCQEPKGPRFVRVLLSYQTYGDDLSQSQLRSYALWVPVTLAKSIQTTFLHVQYLGLRIANMLNVGEMPRGFEHGLFDNITTSAVCHDMKGAERYVLFINPAQNPMLTVHLPCPEEVPYCVVDVFPATATLAINRHAQRQGSLDLFVPVFVRQGLEYYHTPSNLLVSWSTLALHV